MLHQLKRRLMAAPERLRRRSQARVSAAVCARYSDPLAGRGKPLVTTFFDVEGSYAMPGMQSACITTVEKILEIQAAVGIRSTYNVVAQLALDAPDMVAHILADGHEVASHSLRHRVLSKLRETELRQDVLATKRAYKTLGIDIDGHRSPQSSWNDTLMQQLAEQGFRWNAEDGKEPYPYPLAHGPAGTLWRMPVRDDDWQYEASGLKPGDMLRRWQDVVNAHADRGQYAAIGFHPWVERYDKRLSVFKDFMVWLSEHPGVESLPFSKVVERIELPVGGAASAHG